jgi:hypothetical protein
MQNLFITFAVLLQKINLIFFFNVEIYPNLTCTNFSNITRIIGTKPNLIKPFKFKFCNVFNVEPEDDFCRQNRCSPQTEQK